MNVETLEMLETRDQVAATYLEQLQALAFEISVTMDAIADNALPTLQESVAKQEMLCASLATMADTVNQCFGSPGEPSRPRTDAAIDGKIRSTSAAICDLNLQYAALLRHSGKSIAVLASLYRSHTGQFQEARGPRSKHQTWSCEM